MKTTWVRYLGFVGILGVLGFYETQLFNMFWFFLCFRNYRMVRHDEMFENIVNKSCRNAFVATLLLLLVFLPIEILFSSYWLKELDAAILFGCLFSTFQFSLYYYDKNIEEEI